MLPRNKHHGSYHLDLPDRMTVALCIGDSCLGVFIRTPFLLLHPSLGPTPVRLLDRSLGEVVEQPKPPRITSADVIMTPERTVVYQTDGSCRSGIGRSPQSRGLSSDDQFRAISMHLLQLVMSENHFFAAARRVGEGDMSLLSYPLPYASTQQQAHRSCQNHQLSLRICLVVKIMVPF